MRCPICRTDHTPVTRLGPFCSPRCQLIDLGCWLNEEYRVPESTPLAEEDLELAAAAAAAVAGDEPLPSDP
jgi:uncharacterized protein